LTGAAEWAARAREHIAAYGPDCPLGVSLEAKEASPEASEPGGLTPFQRQLLRALVMGEDLDRISKRFSRSSYTISKQVEYIYGHLGVSSVQGLRREAERKGIA
jgi:DNA-binding NarL/FixJ family response regulator